MTNKAAQTKLSVTNRAGNVVAKSHNVTAEKKLNIEIDEKCHHGNSKL